MGSLHLKCLGRKKMSDRVIPGALMGVPSVMEMNTLSFYPERLAQSRHSTNV